MAIQTFELVSPFLSIYTPSKVWKGDSSLLLGQTTNALTPGEMLQITADYGADRLADLVDANQNNNADTITAADGTTLAQNKVPAFAFFSETGRGDIVTGGRIPLLQFGPYEADTMIFDRGADGILINEAGAALSTADIGKPVGVFAVRNYKDFASANPVQGTLMQSGLAVLSYEQIKNGAFKAGYISRISGVGTKMRVRILFGI